jgi:hypothetical protein
MSEEIDKHVIRKYEIGPKLGKGVRHKLNWLHNNDNNRLMELFGKL